MSVNQLPAYAGGIKLKTMGKKKRLSMYDKETIEALRKNGFSIKYVVIIMSERYEVNCIMNYIRMTEQSVIRRNGDWYEKIEL